MNSQKINYLKGAPKLKFKLAVLPGDGVGPELMNVEVKVLEALGKRFGHSFNL